MTENGRVIGLEGDFAVVRFDRRSACDKCGMCGGSATDKHIDVRLKNDCDVKTGDGVVVEIKSQTVLLSAVIAYLIPLAVAIGAMLVCYFAGAEEWLTFTVFMLALLVGYLIVHWVAKRFSKRIDMRILDKVTVCEGDSK
ncbi:MAG: SoxR reducing system RseC family protein [Clostridia bacterium]|nr:SoxR reducing system RseC family protein [Clostridia bacterium]